MLEYSGRGVFMSVFKELEDKLKEYFEVSIEECELRLNQEPKVIIVFDKCYSNIITKNLSMYRLEGLLISAESYVRFNMGPIFGKSPKGVVINTNPYKIEVQALIPVIEVFVHRILLDPNKKEEK